MRNHLLILFIYWFFVMFGSAAALASEQGNKTEGGHKPGEFELGFSAGYAYLSKDKENATNLHLHVVKNLPGDGLEKYFSFGLGMEAIFAEERHYGTMAFVAIHPWHHLVLSVGPGIVWVQHDGKWESEAALHLEVAYLFEGAHFHYGPVFGYAQTSDEQHYTVGMHFGLPF